MRYFRILISNETEEDEASLMAEINEYKNKNISFSVHKSNRDYLTYEIEVKAKNDSCTQTVLTRVATSLAKTFALKAGKEIRVYTLYENFVVQSELIKVPRNQKASLATIKEKIK